MFIEVKTKNGNAKIDTDCVVKYQKLRETTEVCLDGHFDVDFSEPTFEEFDEIMDPKRKKRDWSIIALKIATIFITVALGISLLLHELK